MSTLARTPCIHERAERKRFAGAHERTEEIIKFTTAHCELCFEAARARVLSYMQRNGVWVRA